MASPAQSCPGLLNCVLLLWLAFAALAATGACSVFHRTRILTAGARDSRSLTTAVGGMVGGGVAQQLARPSRGRLGVCDQAKANGKGDALILCVHKIKL